MLKQELKHDKKMPAMISNLSHRHSRESDPVILQFHLHENIGLA